jgi:membrane-bound metal-dependent hydrolase YbcI (DUF457 family)
MDNVCHTLVGAAFGEAGLKQRTRFGQSTLMIAANLPDLDVLVFATDVPSVAFRRGWTHGTMAQALLPVLLATTFYAIGRMRSVRADGVPVRMGWLLLLSYVGVLSHVALDWLNSYGIRLPMPFDGRWFYGDTLFIIDPWLWLTLGVGVWLARRRGGPGPARRYSRAVVTDRTLWNEYKTGRAQSKLGPRLLTGEMFLSSSTVLPSRQNGSVLILGGGPTAAWCVELAEASGHSVVWAGEDELNGAFVSSRRNDSIARGNLTRRRKEGKWTVDGPVFPRRRSTEFIEGVIAEEISVTADGRVLVSFRQNSTSLTGSIPSRTA